MYLKAVKLYGDGVYHLYDDKHLYCPFISKHGLNNAREYTVKLYNDKTVCKYCSDNFKQMAFRGIVTIPPIINVWGK